MIYGYVRRSMVDTDITFAEQKDAVFEAVKSYETKDSIVEYRIIADHASGWATLSKRPGKAKMMESIVVGDIIILSSPDRIAGNVLSFYDFIKIMNVKGVTVVVAAPRNYIDSSSSPVGDMLIFEPGNNLQMLDPLKFLEAISGLESAIVSERLMSNKRLNSDDPFYNKSGRRPSLNGEKIKKFKEMVEAKVSQAQISKELNISQATVSRYVSDFFKNGRVKNKTFYKEGSSYRKKYRDIRTKKLCETNVVLASQENVVPL